MPIVRQREQEDELVEVAPRGRPGGGSIGRARGCRDRIQAEERDQEHDAFHAVHAQDGTSHRGGEAQGLEADECFEGSFRPHNSDHRRCPKLMVTRPAVAAVAIVWEAVLPRLRRLSASTAPVFSNSARAKASYDRGPFHAHLHRPAHSIAMENEGIEKIDRR
jgi:hypothetical protein